MLTKRARNIQIQLCWHALESAKRAAEDLPLAGQIWILTGT